MSINREAIIAELATLESQRQPIRRFSITIKAGGDTREALVSELRNIVSSIANGGTGGYMGGPDAGSLHDLLELPGVTGESYLAALKEWLKGQERIDELNQQLADLELLDRARNSFACKVCGNIPDEEGWLEHGRGCYTQSEDGGGSEAVDLEERLVEIAEEITRPVSGVRGTMRAADADRLLQGDETRIPATLCLSDAYNRDNPPPGEEPCIR